MFAKWRRIGQKKKGPSVGRDVTKRHVGWRMADGGEYIHGALRESYGCVCVYLELTLGAVLCESIDIPVSTVLLPRSLEAHLSHMPQENACQRKRDLGGVDVDCGAALQHQTSSIDPSAAVADSAVPLAPRHSNGLPGTADRNTTSSMT